MYDSEIYVRVADQTECLPHLQGEEADDDDIYNVLSTLKRLTAFHKYAAVLFNYCAKKVTSVHLESLSAN